MNLRADETIRRARALVGTPFRPQGREPGTGLDCVGLVLSAFEISPDSVRRNYRLRGDHRPEINAGLMRQFRKVARNTSRPGDVLLCAICNDQLHLAISCGASFVHADARLRRIVETPGEPAWPIIGVYRQRAVKSKSS